MKNETVKGVSLGLLSAVIGGLCPVYWKQIAVINPFVILLYRVVLVCASMLLLCMITMKWKDLIAPLKNKGAIRRFFLTGLIMVSNWGIYVWAVNSGYIVQTSIGYFLVPIVVCLIGMIFFKEKVERYKIVGLIIVALGTVALVIAYGEIPTIALGVALTYSTYTSVQKLNHVTGIQAMFYQTLFVMPLALAGIVYVECTGQGAIAVANGTQLLLLSLAGIVTALPLILVFEGINRAPLILMGLTNYAGDTLTMLIGIFIYGEVISGSELSAMTLVWIGIAIFALGGFFIKKNTEGSRAQRLS